MVEQNPLQLKPTASVSNTISNKRGRPRKGNVIRFGPQPASMVSKLLRQEKANIVVDQDKTQPAESVSNSKNTLDEEITSTRKKKKPRNNSKTKFHSCKFENCSYSTEQVSNMTKHLRVHTGEKPFLCDKCSFRTNFINSLKCHKRLHTTDRPYKCTDCSYCCNSISNLKKHFRTRHKSNDDTG